MSETRDVNDRPATAADALHTVCAICYHPLDACKHCDVSDLLQIATELAAVVFVVKDHLVAEQRKGVTDLFERAGAIIRRAKGL